MAYTFAAVRLGSAPKVHLGVSYSDDAKFVTRCAAGRLKACKPTDEQITCINCLTRTDHSWRNPMNLPNDCFLDYVISKEAWYAHVTGPDPEIQIRASSRGGGAHWEFTAVEINGIGVKLGVFDDAFHAFNELPEFFQALAAQGKGCTLDEVRRILDSLGTVDATERVRVER